MGIEAAGVIGRLIEELNRLPGIGPKTAERLTHHLLAAPRSEVLALADALRDVKEKIRRIITNEDPKRPLSDQRIAEMLKASNIDIARRTVTKYREAMNILSSTKRRQIG